MLKLWNSFFMKCFKFLKIFILISILKLQIISLFKNDYIIRCTLNHKIHKEFLYYSDVKRWIIRLFL